MDKLPAELLQQVLSFSSVSGDRKGSYLSHMHVCRRWEGKFGFCLPHFGLPKFIPEIVEPDYEPLG